LTKKKKIEENKLDLRKVAEHFPTYLILRFIFEAYCGLDIKCIFKHKQENIWVVVFTWDHFCKGRLQGIEKLLKQLDASIEIVNFEVYPSGNEVEVELFIGIKNKHKKKDLDDMIERCFG